LKRGRAIPELSLSYNPFPRNPTVSITSSDELMNGARFNPDIRADTVQEFQDKFIDFHNKQRVRLGFLWSARVESSKGFGKTALLAHFLRRINLGYGENLPGKPKVVALYVKPESSAGSFKKLAVAICSSLIRQDPVTESTIITDIMRTIRYRVITTESFPTTLFSEKLEFETLEDFERLTSPTWVKGEAHLSGIRTGVRDYLLGPGGLDEDLAEILADYEEKFIREISRWINRDPVNFLFNDAVTLFKLAGFSGAYLFIDDLYQAISNLSQKARDTFADELRNWLFDGPNSKTARDSFFTVVMTFHPDLERTLADSWKRSDLRRMANFDIDRSPSNNVELRLLDKDDTLKLLRTYTEPAISDDQLKQQNGLHPLTEETALILATPPIKPGELLGDAHELIQQAKVKGIKGTFSKSFVEEFIRETRRSAPSPSSKEMLESLIDADFG
jgi:hypothetical protein